MSSFPDWFPHYACTAAKSAHSDFVGSRVSACSGVTRHLHFCLNDRGLLRAIAVTRGMERTPNKSQHTELTLEKKILLPLLPEIELATFRSRAEIAQLAERRTRDGEVAGLIPDRSGGRISISRVYFLC